MLLRVDRRAAAVPVWPRPHLQLAPGGGRVDDEREGVPTVAAVGPATSSGRRVARVESTLFFNLEEAAAVEV